MENVKQDFITLKITPTSPNKADVKFEIGYYTYHYQDKSGLWNCYIPSFDLYFNAKSFDEIMPTGRALTSGWIKSWVVDISLNRFIQHLRVLRFNPSQDIWVNYLKKRDKIITKGENKFKKSLFNIPKNFKNATSTNTKVSFSDKVLTTA